ncbi:MAG: D-alanyl-alanine synthetase [Pseudomonadota bacterium]
MQNRAARAEQRVAPSVKPETGVRLGLQRIVEALMPKIRLAIIFGGNKNTPGSVLYHSNNTRSWKSYEVVAEDIAASLRRSGFRHVDVIPEDMALSGRLHSGHVHMAWLNSGGVQGHNSAAHAPSMLEMLGVPYVGHDPLNATTLDNKHAFKRGVVCTGLPTSPFIAWHMDRGSFEPEHNSRFKLAFGDYEGPFVVKPVSGRASLHVHVAQTVTDLPDVVAEVYNATGNLVLIEKYLSGREFCISVTGRVTSQGGQIFRNREPFAFGALERVLQSDELIFTSMDSHPITAKRFKEVDPREGKIWSELHRIARDVFLEFNLGSLIRLDLRADKDNNLFILEANPKPDLKQPSAGVTSLVGAGLAQTNLSYDDLIVSMFADRMDYLLRHRRESVAHILDLIPSQKLDLSEFDPEFSRLEQETDTMVQMLAEKARQMGFYEA